MATPDPTQGAVPLGGGDDERERAAQMWDRLVEGGMDPEEATRRVAAETGVQPEPGEDEGAGLSGAVRTVAQGATLGFGDELEGLARGAAALVPGGTSPGEAFREGTEAARADVERFREDHPVGSLALEGVGGLATGGAGALRALGASGVRAGGRALARTGIRRLAARGAAEGAVAGAGVSEGGIGDRALGAAGGAVLGGATGGLLGGAGAVTRGARSRASGLLERALRRQGFESVEEAVRSLGPGETLIDLAARTGESARRDIGRTAAGAALGAGAGAALDPEGSPIEGALAGAGLGAGASRVRLAGTPVQRLARAAQSIPGEGSERIRTTLTERAARSPQRVLGALRDKTGLTFDDAVQTVEDLAARKRANAAPLYREAYEKSVSITGDVADVLTNDDFRRAYDRGRRIAALEGVELPDLPDLGAVREMGIDPTRVEGLGELPVQAIDYMKRGMDDLIEGRMRGGSIGRTEARALRNRLRGVLETVDEQVPEYAAARAQYAGDAAMEDAFQRGIEDFTGGGRSATDPRAVERVVAEMTPSERDLYRRGALDALRQRIETASDFGRNPDAARRIVGSEEMRQRIRQLFDSADDFDAFMDLMERETGMMQAGQFVLGGSPTARIQAEQTELVPDAGFSFSDLRPGRMLGRALDASVTNRARGIGEQTVGELAPMLTATGDEGLAGVTRRLGEAAEGEATRTARLRALSAALGIPLALGAGRVATGAGGSQ